MATFKEVTERGRDYLIISNDDGDKVIKLPIFQSLVGTCAARWPKFDQSHHPSIWTETNDSRVFLKPRFEGIQSSPADSFSTLGRKIICGEVRWGHGLRILGEPSYIKNYWEWTESILSRHNRTLRSASLYDAIHASLFIYDRDTHVFRAFCEAWCPTTNSLHTSLGELSISLWDLHYLGGLPIVGTFYEEVNPHASEITSQLNPQDAYIFPSCKYLYLAYYSIITQAEGRKNKKVYAHEWIDFWFKGATFYIKPPALKSTRSQEPWTPSGAVPRSTNFSNENKKTFLDLNVPERLWDAVQLAAFISCWLCVFALPSNEVNVLRPSTFRAASVMASGKQICLAIPVLASIYKGLNEIALSTTPGKSNFCFPSHYVYIWMAYYFGTHSLAPIRAQGSSMIKYSGEGRAIKYSKDKARTLIHCGSSILFNATSLRKKKTELFVDEGRPTLSELSYFSSIKSSYLPLRFDDIFYVEPYTPYRFARQFGFCQDIPQTLTDDNRSASSEEAIKFWLWSAGRKTNSQVTFPVLPSSPSKNVTSRFTTWWSAVHGNYLLTNQDVLIQSTIPEKASNLKKGKEIDNVDDDVVLQRKKIDIAISTKPCKLKLTDTSARMKIVENIDRPGKQVLPEKAHSSNKESEQGDTHWKRQKRKSIISDPEPIDFDLDDIFDGVPIIQCSGENYPEKLSDLSLPDAIERISQGSTGSISGPDLFDRLAEEGNKSLTMKKTKISPTCAPSTASVFYGDNIVLNGVSSMWEQLSHKISKCHWEKLGDYECETEKVLEAMERMSSLDFSSLRGLVSNYFSQVKIYNNQRLTNSESRKKLLEAKKAELIVLLADEKQRLEQIELVEKELTRQAAELSDLRNAGPKLQTTITVVNEEILSLEANPAQSSEESARLGEMRTLLEEKKMELINHKLFS